MPGFIIKIVDRKVTLLPEGFTSANAPRAIAWSFRGRDAFLSLCTKLKLCARANYIVILLIEMNVGELTIMIVTRLCSGILSTYMQYQFLREA